MCWFAIFTHVLLLLNLYHVAPTIVFIYSTLTGPTVIENLGFAPNIELFREFHVRFFFILAGFVCHIQNAGINANRSPPEKTRQKVTWFVAWTSVWV